MLVINLTEKEIFIIRSSFQIFYLNGYWGLVFLGLLWNMIFQCCFGDFLFLKDCELILSPVSNVLECSLLTVWYIYIAAEYSSSHHIKSGCGGLYLTKINFNSSYQKSILQTKTIISMPLHCWILITNSNRLQ